MDNKKIIYYWNMKSSLNSKYITHIHLLSITFDFNEDNMPYIYMGNYSPYHPMYNDIWEQLETIAKKGIYIVIVIGGSTNTFYNLFNYYDIFKSLLIQFLKDKYHIISGINIMIDDEYTTYKNIQQFIGDIYYKLPLTFYKQKFIISIMAYSNDIINKNNSYHMSYIELYNTKEGKLIDYFNCISYYHNNVCDIINYGFHINKIVIGCIYIDNIKDYCINIESINKTNINKKSINNINKTIGGICIFDYNKLPKDWDYYIYLALKSV